MKSVKCFGVNVFLLVFLIGINFFLSPFFCSLVAGLGLVALSFLW